MDYEVIKWVRVVHIFGVLAWAGSLIGLSFILKAHAGAAEEARADFIKLEKGNAISMDIFATLAIGAGLVLLFGIEPSPMKSGGWMHAKLTAIFAILCIHVMQRMRVSRYRKGDVTAYPTWLIPLLQILVISVIVFASGKPF